VNENEARALLRRHLLAYRSRSHPDLASLIGHPQHLDVTGASGAPYQIEVEAFWDDEPGGNIRVLGTIDDGGLRALKPLADDFIIAPDGTFVGE
jgi:hypothetical protein